MNDHQYPTRSIKFDWLYIFFASWMLTGAYVDAWAHWHFADSIETFFTPWHALLYSGAASVGVFLLANAFINRRRGYSWKRSLPPEYLTSLIGFIIFMVGGVADLAWHEIFGIEADIEALYSPSHIVLFIGATLMMSGPWRGIWHRPELATKFSYQLPAILSLTLTLSILAFITQDFHPYVQVFMGLENEHYGDIAIVTGIMTFIIQSGILAGLLLPTIRRIPLPFGSFTIIMTLNSLGLVSLQDSYVFILTSFVSGVALDLIFLLLRHRIMDIKIFRLFAFSVPAVLFYFYVLTVHMTNSVWWSVHVWMGVVVLSGFTGFLMSYVIFPPATKSDFIRVHS